MDETITQEEPTPPSQTTMLTTHEEQTLSNATLETDIAFTEAPSDFGTDVITILIYAAPAIILVLLIPIIILIVQRKRRKKQQEDVQADEDVKRRAAFTLHLQGSSGYQRSASAGGSEATSDPPRQRACRSSLQSGGLMDHGPAALNLWPGSIVPVRADTWLIAENSGCQPICSSPSPIFEEDTPSVMEIEMDDLDKWMSNMKNSCRLSTLEEENKFNTSVES